MPPNGPYGPSGSNGQDHDGHHGEARAGAELLVVEAPHPRVQAGSFSTSINSVSATTPLASASSPMPARKAGAQHDQRPQPRWCRRRRAGFARNSEEDQERRRGEQDRRRRLGAAGPTTAGEPGEAAEPT
jgi:hypothetical protein